VFVSLLIVMTVFQIFGEQRDRIRQFTTSLKLYEANVTGREVSTHIESQEQDAVNLRHIVANTAHDLKTVSVSLSSYASIALTNIFFIFVSLTSHFLHLQPVVAMVSGCEVLFANMSEMTKLCSQLKKLNTSEDSKCDDSYSPTGTVSLFKSPSKSNLLKQNNTEKALMLVSRVVDEIDNVIDTLKDIKSTSNFMLTTINRFLDYTKVAHGFKLVPKQITFNIKEALNLSLLCIGKSVIEGKVKIGKFPWNMCPYVISDKQWFEENIICLISNALKFSPNGGIEIRITLKKIHPGEQQGSGNNRSNSISGGSKNNSFRGLPYSAGGKKKASNGGSFRSSISVGSNNSGRLYNSIVGNQRESSVRIANSQRTSVLVDAEVITMIQVEVFYYLPLIISKRFKSFFF
jgi:signal transduction histidine kinase